MAPITPRLMIEKAGKLEKVTGEVILPLRAILVIAGVLLTKTSKLKPRGETKIGNAMPEIKVDLSPRSVPSMARVRTAVESEESGGGRFGLISIKKKSTLRTNHM